jgi:hypothetical protein
MDIGKVLIAAGIVFILLGLGWSLGLGRLPGDVVIRRGNFTFFFPIVTSIILSIILTILLSLLLRQR